MTGAAASGRSAAAGASLDMAQAFQSHPVATFVLSSNGTIVDANQAAEQLFNRGRSAFVGAPVDRLIGSDGGPEIASMLSQPTKSMWAFSITLNRRSQPPLLADMAFSPFADGTDLRIVAIHPVPRGGRVPFRRPGAAARSAGAAAAMLAHEIKNPLSGIRGAAQLLGKDPRVGDPGELSALIVREVDRIATLIDGMQAFTQGAPRPNQPFNIYPAIAQARAIAEQGFSQSIHIAEDFDPSLPMASGEHDGLVQILINLIQNAAEALDGRPDATILVSTAYRHGLSWDADDGRGQRPLPVEICVADNGPGVADTIIDSLFDPFVTGKRDGQGLGLALVDKLVRDMGGLVQHERSAGWTRLRVHLSVGAAASHCGDGS